MGLGVRIGFVGLLMLCMGTVLGGRAVASDVATALSLVRAGQPGEAVGILRQLAENGDTVAQVNLAVLHARGEGVPLNDMEAAYWAWRARLMGERRAVGPSDLILERLPDRARNQVAARLASDLEEIASLGQMQALVALGRLETQVRQPPRPRRAALWYTLAAAFDVPFARALREATITDLSPAVSLNVQTQALDAFADWCMRVPSSAKTASCPEDGKGGEDASG